MKRAPKGSMLYLPYMRKRETVKTVIFFAVSLAIFVTGLIFSGTSANLLTVVAVLGCLPSGRSAVSMIMYLRAGGCSKQTFEAIEGLGIKEGFYSLYFTSYSENYDISHLVLTENSILAYSEDERIKEDGFETHIREMLAQNGYRDIHVKLWKNREAYLQRLRQIPIPGEEKQREAGDGREKKEGILRLLFAVSL